MSAGTRAPGTVLVTGANSGLGLATALELARRGHHVVGTTRSEEKADTLRAAAAELGVEVDTTLLDVTDAGRCAEVVDAVRPRVVVNNAGYALTGPVENVPDEEAERLLATLLVAPMRLARLALPHIRDQGGGRIVNISSILGRVSNPLTGWYQAAKHGLEAASDALRIEVARDGIDVVLIEPGFFATAIFDELEADERRFGDDRYREAFRRTRQGLERTRPLMGDPRDVARTVVRAVETSRPRPRYLVGIDAQVLDATRPLTPTAINDRLQRMVTGL
jgi:NAD(P)-dependent dehydrogenase (short-subunit alcohol dehydrogenase family)